jgi:hypothetical protein
MTRKSLTGLSLAMLFAGLALPALAQGVFPVDKSYKAVSISGFDVQNKGLSLTVVRDAGSGDMRGGGNAGCNNWTASVSCVTIRSTSPTSSPPRRCARNLP